MAKKAIGAMTKLIAVGNGGSSFTELSEAQMKAIKFNGENERFALEHRSDAQLIASRAGKHQDSLGYDTRSYMTSRGSTIWLGSLENALKLKLVRKAVATVIEKDKEVKLNVHVRTGWKEAEGYDQWIACESVAGGRIESASVGHGEKRRAGSKKNALFLRKIKAIEFAK